MTRLVESTRLQCQPDDKQVIEDREGPKMCHSGKVNHQRVHTPPRVKPRTPISESEW